MESQEDNNKSNLHAGGQDHQTIQALVFAILQKKTEDNNRLQRR